jgi:hypothetical protein
MRATKTVAVALAGALMLASVSSIAPALAANESTVLASANSRVADGTDLDKVAAATLRYAKTMVGKLPSVARRCAVAHGYYIRTVAVDGVQRPVTKDYWANRIDLEFTKGRISKVSVG